MQSGERSSSAARASPSTITIATLSGITTQAGAGAAQAGASSGATAAGPTLGSGAGSGIGSPVGSTVALAQRRRSRETRAGLYARASAAADSEEVAVHLPRVVAALVAAELGDAAGADPPPSLPAPSLRFFLDHVEHFRRNVAYAALRLLERLVDEDDGALALRLGSALGRFSDLYPSRVEAALMQLAVVSSLSRH